MATRKVKRKRSAAPRRRTVTRKAPVRRRKTTRRKKGMLSEMFTPAMARGGFNTTFSGFVGGNIGLGVERMMPNQNNAMQIGAMVGGAFILATVGGMPNVAAGLSGVAGYKTGKQIAGLADGSMLANDYANEIEQLPLVLDEEGNPIVMNDGAVLADGVTLMDAAGNVLRPSYAPVFGGY
jgi:hypothetical protein